MKKILFTILALGAAISLWASNYEIDGWWVYKAGDNVIITYKGSNYSDYNEYVGDLVIPETLTDGTQTYTVTGIGEEAFWACTELTSITIPASVKSIGNIAFADCTSLSSVTIKGSGLTTIGNNAFSSCINLTEIILPTSLESIGDAAFASCYELGAITIPGRVTSIGSRAFMYCHALQSISVYANNPNYSSTDGVLFDKEQTTLICYPESKTNTTYTLPSTVRAIKRYAFENAKKLKTITLTDSIEMINDGTFRACSSLSTITIPASVDTIGDSAFDGCKALSSITCKAIVPPICSEHYCFGDVNKSIPVYVPAESVAVYQGAPIWHEFTNIRAIPSEGLEELQSGKRQGKKVIENGVLYIERNGRTFTTQGQEVK